VQVKILLVTSYIMRQHEIIIFLLLHTFVASVNAFQQSIRHLSLLQSRIYPAFRPKKATFKRQSRCWLYSRRGHQRGYGCWATSHSERCSSSTDHDVEILYDASDTDINSTQNSENDDFFSEAERDANRINYTKGTPDGFYVTKQFSIPPEGFQNIVTNADGTEGTGITQEEVDRLGICATNITIPIALMLLDGEAYPSLSRARKSCRKGYIVVHRGPLVVNNETGLQEFNNETCFRGRVIDRVFPGDVIGIQCRMHGGFYPGFETTKPPFDLPVIYEDDHFAIVNKPAGIVCYSQRKQSHGMMTVRAALPFALKPPKRGTLAIIRRPASVHRLDKPTSGLLLVAKTKPAMVDLTKQFVERRVKKTYTAILNGIPSEPTETSITTEDALKLGVDVDPEDDCHWQLIDHALDEKSAVTVWKPLRYVKSLKANDGILTLVEMKPKTGRYHQLRRHMSWVRECPIIGDTSYDGGGDAINLRGRGLFLCSNKVSLDHPYFNTLEGRAEWENLPDEEKWANGTLALSEDGATVEIHARIDVPNKFKSFLGKEEERQEKLGDKPDITKDNI